MAVSKRRFGDRYDGRRLRSLDSFYTMIPYIMRTRLDSQNCFEDKIDISHTENFLRRKRKDEDVTLSMLHVVIAAMVRTVALRPALNRFVAGQKIFSRNEILVALVIKKGTGISSQETVLRIKFEPADTLTQIADKINIQVEKNKKVESTNDADKATRLFMLCPGLLLKFLVFVIRQLDYFGIMPRAIHNVSPFHTSFFVTDLGSLGIQPVYHHLYDFGTTSCFIAFGMKFKENLIDAANNIVEKRFISIKAVTDERIVDGSYYASAFKLYRSLIQHPEKLEFPPEHLEPDVD
jgi:hypothetical protein